MSKESSQGNVHSGNSAVKIAKGGVLTQLVPIEEAACYYKFSFFAKGSASGGIGFTASVTFQTPGGPVTDGQIVVRDGDLVGSNNNFAYFRIVTSVAPLTATGVEIKFEVPAVTGGQSLIVDDVSFGI